MSFFFKNPVHGADGTDIGVFIEERRIDLPGSLVREALFIGVQKEQPPVPVAKEQGKEKGGYLFLRGLSSIVTGAGYGDQAFALKVPSSRE
jgi:hypothetical protein